MLIANTVVLPATNPVRQVQTLHAEQGPAAALVQARSAAIAADPTTRGRLLWLMGKLYTEAGELTSARESFETLGTSDHPLAQWGRLEQAKLVEEADPSRALALLDGLNQAWGGAAKARRIIARSLARSGQDDLAIPRLRELLSQAPEGSPATYAALPLARLLSQSEELDARRESVELFFRIATQAPISQSGREALRAADRILLTLPAEAREALMGARPQTEFARAAAMLRNRQYRASERAFRAISRANSPGSAAYCDAAVQEGRSMIKRRARREGAVHMDAVAAACDQDDVVAISLFNSARANGRTGNLEGAILRYDELIERTPRHRLADDALFRSAIASHRLERITEMVSRLSRMQTQYPEGDMRGEAQFRLAFHQFEQQEFPAALAVWDELIRLGPQENAEGVKGRALYWRARTLVELNRADEAKINYRDLVRRWPLSYYAQQALARLSGLDAPLQQSLLRELRGEDSGPLRFPWREAFESPGFLRALEMLRVDEPEYAQEEFRELGFLERGADPELLWVVAALLNRAGSLPTSSRLVRRRLASFHQTPPVGRNQELWRLAYPSAFDAEITAASAEANVPASFLRAVAREESAFNPRAVSVANAFGLIQLIRPTAERFAAPLGLSADRESLFNPAINLRVGANFIKFLRNRYSDNRSLVPASYNAGHGAVDRWLRSHGDQDLDRFIENIPYDETRRYSRRVLQSFGVYSWLDTGMLPPMPRRLPQR
jgi:soluble lytic murein transglycosylase